MCFCDQCGRIYPTQTHLNSHINYFHKKKFRYPPKRRENTNVKDKKCPHCDKMFYDGQKLSEHAKVVHEKIFKFECEECSRKFFNESIFRDHKTAVHSKVKCDVCHEVIYNKFFLDRHKVEVHGIPPTKGYICDHCSKYFRTKYGLDNHIQKLHPGI